MGALPRGIAIFGQDEDDTIQIYAGNRTAQNAFVIDGGGGTANVFEFFTNSGYEDVVSVDGLNLTVQLGPDPGSALAKTASLAGIQTAKIRTAGGADSITVTPAQFSIQGGGTCVGGSLLPPGATCRAKAGARS